MILGYPLLDRRDRSSSIGPRNPTFLIVQIAPVSVSSLPDSMTAVGDDKLEEVGEYGYLPGECAGQQFCLALFLQL